MDAVDLRLALPLCLLALACAATPALATFPGRNGSIVLERYYGALSSGFGESHTLAVLNPRSRGERTIRACHSAAHYEPPSGCRLAGARVSPDGRRLALLVRDNTLPDATNTSLEITTIRGTVITRAATERFESLAWAPDGQSLLASRAGGGLFVIGLDGKARRQVASGEASLPDWSAKGDIAFSKADGLYVTPVGAGERRIGPGQSPSWSPDGRRLAFVSDQRVVVARADGTKRRVIAGFSGPPSWSPDGKRIALGEMHTVKPNGKGLRRLHPECSFYCSVAAIDWQPLRRRR
jgi:Tol biopolymer transport system component